MRMSQLKMLRLRLIEYKTMYNAEYQRKYRQTHKVKAAEYAKEYAQSNRGKQANKRAQKKHRQIYKIKYANISQSSYKGVFHTCWGWRAQIKTNGREIYLGLFNTPKLAAITYDKAAIKYHGTKAQLNFTDRLITVQQEQVYRLCSPDFCNLTYEQAGTLLGICAATVCCELKRIKRKCPQLFPLYHRLSNLSMSRALDRSLYYQPWMDDKIIMKF